MQNVLHALRTSPHLTLINDHEDDIIIIISILQMRKVMNREVKCFAQGYTAIKLQSLDSRVGSLLQTALTTSWVNSHMGPQNNSVTSFVQNTGCLMV